MVVNHEGVDMNGKISSSRRVRILGSGVTALALLLVGGPLAQAHAQADALSDTRAENSSASPQAKKCPAGYRAGSKSITIIAGTSIGEFDTTVLRMTFSGKWCSKRQVVDASKRRMNVWLQSGEMTTPLPGIGASVVQDGVVEFGVTKLGNGRSATTATIPVLVTLQTCLPIVGCTDIATANESVTLYVNDWPGQYVDRAGNPLPRIWDLR